MTEEERKAKAKASRNAWKKANVEKVREYNKAWKKANPEKNRKQRAAWKLANAAKVAESRRMGRLRKRAMASRTPDGLKTLLMSMRWTRRRAIDGQWLVAPWVFESMAVLPVQAICDWMAAANVGLAVVDGVAIEFRYVDRFDIAGDFAAFRLGYKRIMDLDGMRQWLRFMSIDDPWHDIDCSPECYEWAECLRNVYGHDLTQARTVLGAKHRRFPCSINLAAIDVWLEEHGLTDHFHVTVDATADAVAVRCMVLDRVVFCLPLTRHGGLLPHAINSAVDALKMLPTTCWNRA